MSAVGMTPTRLVYLPSLVTLSSPSDSTRYSPDFRETTPATIARQSRSLPPRLSPHRPAPHRVPYAHPQSPSTPCSSIDVSRLPSRYADGAGAAPPSRCCPPQQHHSTRTLAAAPQNGPGSDRRCTRAPRPPCASARRPAAVRAHVAAVSLSLSLFYRRSGRGNKRRTAS